MKLGILIIIIIIILIFIYFIYNRTDNITIFSNDGISLTDKFPLFYYENFLSKEECEEVIKEVPKFGLSDSQLTVYAEGFRTSKTAHMLENNKVTKMIEDKIYNVMKIPLCYTEPMQIQKYEIGQEFKPHTDWFQEYVDVEKKIIEEGGQRTWTFMVYLNDTEEGGETIFHNAGIKIKPKTGSAIAWYNLKKDGSGNEDTLHSGAPIIKGEKYVITKWFRDRSQNSCLFSN